MFLGHSTIFVIHKTGMNILQLLITYLFTCLMTSVLQFCFMYVYAVNFFLYFYLRAASHGVIKNDDCDTIAPQRFTS